MTNHIEKIFHDSLKISIKEIVRETKGMTSSPNHAQFLNLLKVVTNDSAWVGQAFLRHLKQKMLKKNQTFAKNSESDLIINAVVNNIPLPGIAPATIFKAIFSELEHSHHNPAFKTALKIPEIKLTIVLISGVLNEIFSTPAFERGAQHLYQKHGIRYIKPKVNGLKASQHNIEVLHTQLTEYIKQNKNEKLWLVAFSKGGIDTLHYIKKYTQFSRKYIKGVSTIASPILGAKNSDHKFIEFAGAAFSSDRIKKSKEALELKNSLSEKSQKSWFKKNHTFFPRDLFYTSVAFEATWYESHIWMVITKMLFQNASINDGVVEAENALFPNYFHGLSLGILKGHHMIGTRSSYYSQEALLEAHIILLDYLKLLG